MRLSVAFDDRTPTVEMTEPMITVATVIYAFLILLLVYFVWLAAQRARMAALGAGTAWCCRYLAGADDRRQGRGTQQRHRGRLLRAERGGLYFSFTGDAQGWFNA